tara:strand:+ start:1438 stop:1800 length:363 start_codon:yes stop_codon:yes gene_type:complete
VIDDFFNDPFDDYKNISYINMDTNSYFYEEGDNLILEYKVPGLSKEDMDVILTKDYITIEGQDKKENRNSFYTTSVYKKYFIPQNINREKIEAKVKNGILKIKFPKTQNKINKKRMIKIN